MNPLLPPILVLIGWTLVVWLWMYATNPLPAFRGRPAPANAQYVRDNYNHLLEQPTIFYAIAFCIMFAHHVDRVHVWCAWIYTSLRIVHSLVQGTTNVIRIRFAVFTLSSIAL